jgi:hypothetical protein
MIHFEDFYRSSSETNSREFVFQGTESIEKMIVLFLR